MLINSWLVVILVMCINDYTPVFLALTFGLWTHCGLAVLEVKTTEKHIKFQCAVQTSSHGDKSVDSTVGKVG